MQKLTRKSLDELAILMPVINEIRQKTYIGGGDGSIYSPYTIYEFDYLVSIGSWNGGYIDGWGYTAPEVTILGSYDGSGSNEGSGSYGGNGSNGYSGTFNINNAVNYLTNNAQESSSGYCARYVREAIEAGGLSTDGRPGSACDYDTYLSTIGFSMVDSSGYIPQVGDIIVHEATSGHEHGHIAMYNGEQWVSDFFQNDMYGGSAYRNNPNYTILRWNQ
ncbi:hypothetical protein [Proteiniphilum acetatigenes]|uniref:hypothetical protein n=1 Tax=Proteiniphilum acetatigenes TaxID=294710 RepID=UPI000399E6E5|nr:hypothetical protein [Proteiniphilum acetatigenes]SFL63001.1 hypothetical protein SAMN05216357_1375 [Porphyromonadaceae bacterium KH3CP3RA]